MIWIGLIEEKFWEILKYFCWFLKIKLFGSKNDKSCSFKGTSNLFKIGIGSKPFDLSATILKFAEKNGKKSLIFL